MGLRDTFYLMVYSISFTKNLRGAVFNISSCRKGHLAMYIKAILFFILGYGNLYMVIITITEVKLNRDIHKQRKEIESPF